MSMTFHAIDVETANSNRDSICQIGIVYVRNGAIRDQWDTLVNPEGWFDPYNIGIHGITSNDVRSSPTWDEFHEDLSGRLSGSIMVSHSPFDKVAVKRTTEKYGLLHINVKWLDSAMIVRRAWPEHFGQKGGVDPLSWTVYRFSDHEMFQQAFCIKSYTQGESSSLGVVISTSG